jgi:hypothetical protein
MFKLPPEQVQLLAAKGYTVPPAYKQSRTSRDVQPSLALDAAAKELAAAEAERRRTVFLDVARNLNLPPYSSFTSQPPEQTPGEREARRRFRNAEPRDSQIRSREQSKAPLRRGPAGIDESTRSKIFALLGLDENGMCRK